MDKNTLTSSKEEITRLAIKAVEDTFGNLTKVLSDIEIAQKNLVALTGEYSDVVRETNRIKKEISDAQAELKRSQDKLESDTRDFNNKVLIFNKKIEEGDKEYADTIYAKSQIEKQIKEAEGTLTSLKMQAQSLQVLTDELDAVRAQLKTAQDELVVATEERNKAMGEKDYTIANANAELQAIVDDIANKRLIVFPTMEELDARSKSLDEREAGLEVIIQRYKKLYGDQGANFKV
jgi:DNA repair exonuclease SbcCD ATPase subunit